MLSIATVQTVPHLPAAGLTSVDISADSTVAITGSEDMTAKISNIHTGKVLGTFVGNSLHSCHDFSVRNIVLPCPNNSKRCPRHLQGIDQSAADGVKHVHGGMHSYKSQISTTWHMRAQQRL